MAKAPTRNRTVRMTMRGAVLLVAGLSGIVAGLATSDPIVTRFGLLFLVVLTGSWFLARVNLRRLRVTRNAPECVTANEDFQITVSVHNSKTWFDTFALEVEDATLPFWRKGMLTRRLRAGESADLVEMTRIVNRGEYSRKSCKLRSSFPFGLFTAERHLRPSFKVLVFPKPELPKQLKRQLETNLFEGENVVRYERDYSGEFHGIREFQPGDSRKSIHWPATARRRTLMVREWDRPQPEKFSVVFHSFIPPGKPVLPEGFDHAMELLSGLFFHCRQFHIPAQFTASFVDWETMDLSDPQELRPILATLARAQMRAEHSPQPLIDAINSIPGHHRIYVISNVPLKLWASAIPTLPHPVTCLDNREMRVRKPLLRLANNGHQREGQFKPTIPINPENRVTSSGSADSPSLPRRKSQRPVRRINKTRRSKDES